MSDASTASADRRALIRMPSARDRSPRRLEVRSPAARRLETLTTD